MLGEYCQRTSSTVPGSAVAGSDTAVPGSAGAGCKSAVAGCASAVPGSAEADCVTAVPGSAVAGSETAPPGHAVTGPELAHLGVSAEGLDSTLHRVPDLLRHELLALLLHRGLHHGLSRPCYPDCGERLELVLMLLKNVHRLIHVTFEPTIALILTTRGEYCCDCAAVTQEARLCA